MATLDWRKALSGLAQDTSKQDEKKAQEAQYAANMADTSTWKRVGEGVFGANGENSASLMASLLASGDRDSMYDLVSGLNPSDNGVAAARQAFMQNTEYEREQERLKAEQEAAERLRAAMSGGSRPKASASAMPPTQAPTAVPDSVTAEYDARIADLQTKLRQAQRTGLGDTAELESLLKQAQTGREEALANYRASTGDQSAVINDIPNVSRELARQQAAQRREAEAATAVAQATGQTAAQAPRSEAEIWNDLYIAQGENNQGAVEALQRELAQRQALTAAQALGSVPSPESTDPVAPTDRERVEEYNAFAAVDTRDLGSKIAVLENAIREAESAQDQIRQDAADAVKRGVGEGDPYYTSLQSRYDKQQKTIEDAESRIAELQGQIDEKVAYDQSLTPEQRSALQTMSKRIADIDAAQEAVVRAQSVYEQAVKDAGASKDSSRQADLDARYAADLYKARAGQLNALVQQYNTRAQNGADTDTLDILYDQIRQAQGDLNVLGNALETRRDESSAAREEYARAAESVMGAENALGIAEGHLGNTIGRYYDALNNEYAVNDAYREAYENVQGLDVLISGYERKMANAVTAEEVAEYTEKLRELKHERANNEAYAFEYEMSRALAGLSSRDLYVFKELVKNKQTLESLSNDVALAGAVGDYAAVGSLAYQAGEATSNREILNLYRDYVKRLGAEAYDQLLGYVEREENRRKQENRVKAMQNANVGELIGASAASILTNILSAPGVISEVIVQSALSDAPTDVNAPGFTAQNLTRAIRGTTGERIEQGVTAAGGSDFAAHWANTLYSTLMSGIDSFVAAGISGVAGGWAGEAVLGITAASNAAQEAVERGDTVGSAVIRGIVAGTFETLFEHLSIEKILDTEVDFKKGLKDVLKKFGNTALAEGSEEFFTEIANMAYDGLVWLFDGKSELANRYEELKAQYNLTDPQAKKAFSVELALAMNLPAEWALGLDMFGQAAEAGISGAIMGVGHTSLLSIAPLYNYAKAQNWIRNLGNNLENAEAADMYVQLQDTIRTLPPEYWITLPDFRPGVTTALEVQGYAAQVRDAMEKYNADMKQRAEEHPEEFAEERRKAQELANVRVTTAANMDEVRSNAEAGAAAGVADAQSAQEGTRTAQDGVSRETGEVIPGNETDESEAFNSLADEEARTVLSGLQSKYTGERLTNEVNREAERLIDQGGTDADRGRALLRIYNGETAGQTATESPAQANVQTPAWAEGLDTQDVQTINSAVRSVVRGATERDGTVNAQFAQDIVNDETVRLQAAGREDLVAPFVAAVQEAIAGGNENGNIRNDENVERTSGTAAAEQSGRVAGRAVEAEGTAGSRTESSEQRSAETGRAGQTGGSERVAQTAQAGETTQSAPEGMTDMSDLIPGEGKKGAYVQVVSSEQGGVGYKRRYRRIADEARKLGRKVTFVKGLIVLEDENGKTVETNGTVDTSTGEIWLQVDDPDFTVEQLFYHEVYHGLDAQTKADVKEFVEGKYGTRLNAVLADYAKDYGTDVDPDYLMEELCADIYAGMDRYNWGQKALQQQVRSIVDAGRAQRDARPEATQSQQETREGEAGEETFDPVPDEKIIPYSGGEETVVIDPNGKRYSIKSMEADILEGKFQRDLKRVLGYTDAQVKDLVDGINRIINVIKPHRDILDLNEEFDRNNRPFSPYKPNSDPLYKISLDYSTLCRKRLMTQFIISKLQIQQDRALSAEEQIAVRDMLVEYAKQEKALQVACAMCYVEAARLKSPGMINAYLDDPTAALTLYFAKKNKDAEKRIKAYQQQFKIDHGYAGNAPKSAMSGADVSEMNAESRRMRENYEPSAAEREVIERAKALPRSTYLSPENLANLAANEKTQIIYDAYTAWVRSATRSKALEADVPYYYGDSNRKVGKNGKKVSDKFIESVNRENGMRESSWSDAQMTHLLDHIMAVIDLSVRGSAMHGYTKFVEQVRMFGETGEMWNMSGVAGTQNGLNGKLDPNKRRLNRAESLQLLSFSDTESVNVEEALDARDEFPETAGLQCIGVSDDHIRALLRSEIIDYVIPYHTSGLNEILRRMVNIFGWDNYQDIQEAHPDGSEPNENSDKSNWHVEPVFSEFFVGYDTGMSGEEAMKASADNYIRMCRERGLKPKFAQFTDEEGYWKLLIDRKMVNQKTGELIRQKPVQPIFNFGRIEAEVKRYVANYDSGLQDRALAYITDHWEEIPGRIETLKQNGTVEETIKQANKAEQIRRQALKKAELLANETLAAQTNDVEFDTPRASGRNLRNSMSSRSSASDLDAEYMDAVESVEESGEMDRSTEWQLQGYVGRAAVDWGAVIDEQRSGRIKKPLDLYHGSRFFGFTKYNMSAKSDSAGLIYTTTKREVAANYGGRGQYASVRPIGKGFISGATKTSDIIQNAKTVLQSDYHIVDDAERTSREQEIENAMSELVDRINSLWDLGVTPDSPIWQWDENLYNDGQSYLYNNIYSRITSFPFTVSSRADFDSDQEVLEALEWDLGDYEENLNKVRNYLQEHREEIKDMPGGKELLSLILGFDLFDAYVDVDYTYQKLLSGKELIANKATGLEYPAELQKRLEEIHNVGAYHLYGNLGDKPVIIDGEGHDWMSVKAPEISGDDKYHSTDFLAKKAKEAGYTGMVVKNVYDGGDAADDYIFFNPEQVKSADPITYDDDGNVIPLTERFDTTTPERRNDLRYSRATRDDINADIDAGYAADEDAEEPTASAKMGSVAGGKLLDERARDAYDKAIANGDRELADKIRKQRAAEDKARGLYRELNMERKAYNADGDVTHLNNINRLQAQARDARREANRLAKDTKLDVEQRYTPTQAMKQTESKLMSTYSVPRGERAKTRARIRSLLNTVYLNGYVDYDDAFKLLSDMYDVSTDYIAADPAYDDIASDLRGKHVYVTPQVRALFGDEWNQIRREYYSYGIYLTTRESGSDVTIADAYRRNADKYPAILSPGANMDDERIYSLLYALQLSEGADVSLGEAAEMKSINSDADFEARLDEAFGILKEFGEAANIEVRFRAKHDMDVTAVRTRFQEKEQLARERRARAVVLEKVQRELDRIFKRATVSEQNKVRLASEQNAAIRASVEDMLDDLDDVTKSIMGNDVDLTNLSGVVNWLTKMADKNSGFDASGYVEGEGGELTRAAKELRDYMNGENYELDIETLQDLLTLLRMVEHHLKIANEMVGDNFESVGGAAPQLTKELMSGKKRSTRALKARYYLNEDFMSYSRNLKRYSDWNPHGVMYHVAENLERGDMDYMGYREGADMVLLPFIERRNNAKRKAWLDTAAGRDAKLTELTIPAAQITGRGDAPISETVKVKVSQMMLVHMYLALRDADNLRHIEYGGFSIPDYKLYAEGKKKDAYEKGVTVKLSEDQLRDITDRYLAEEGKEFADLLGQYYTEYSPQKVNYVSRALDGKDKANTPNYYPIVSDPDFLVKNYNVFSGTLEGMGPLTERTKGAVNPVLLVDADETFDWHKEMMARYVGYAKPLRDLRALLNYSAPGMEGRKNNALLIDKYTSNADQLMKDLFAMLETAQFEKAKTLSKIFGNYISNVLTANISSVLKQFAALPLAGATYGMEPIMYALSPKGLATKIDRNLINKYTSYLDDRAAGFVYDQVTDIVRGTNGFKRKVMGQVGSGRYLTWQAALGRNWLTAADYWANKQMWVAAQHYVDTHTNLKPGTQAEIDSGNDLYYKKVAEVFNRMTFDTQTNSNMMSKPNILRRVDSGIKAFTLFKTDAFQIYGITREMLGQNAWAQKNGNAQDKHDAKLKVLHGIEGIVGASIVAAATKFLSRLILRKKKEYADEEGNFDWQKIGTEFGIDALENMTNMMAFGEEIYSVIMAIIDKDTKWYDKETAALDAINRMVSALTTNVPKLMDFFYKLSAAEDKGAFFESNLDAFTTPFKKILWQVAAFAGIPTANYEKNLIAALGWIYPDAAASLQSLGKASQKGDITNKSEMKAYLKDEIGQLSDKAIDAYWSLFEAFDKGVLPGFGEVQMKDENGEDRAMTDEEFAKWDYALRTTMIDAVESVVGSSAYAGLTDDEKAQALSMAAEYARQAGREAVGLDNPNWYSLVHNAMTYGAELGNVLAWYKLRGSNQAEEFAALERLDIPDEQKAAILHGMYTEISKAKDWVKAADSMTDMQFLEFARDKLSAKMEELGVYEPGTVGESAPEPAVQPVQETAPAPEPEEPKADPLQPEYDKAVSAGMSEKGAKAAVQAVKAAGGNDAKERVKQAAAVEALDSVEDQLAAIRYYSEKPEANYARFSRANDYGVTPADFFDFWKAVIANYDSTPKQDEVQTMLDSRTDLTQEEKAVMWQLCGANWSAGKNPYATYVGEQIKAAYDSAK